MTTGVTQHAELLLDGPRGRRLCLELAMEADQELRVALYRLARELNGDGGTSRAQLTSGFSVNSAAQPPAPPLEWILVRLEALKLPAPGDAVIQFALQRSVDTARYWQEPDEEDVLAVLPEIVAALSRVAEQVVAAPSAQWWREPRGVEQWAIDWRVADDRAPLPKNPGKTLSEWARSQRAEEVQAERERPIDPATNWSGTWWSIPHGLVKTVGRLEAGLSLAEDSLGWEHATAVPVRGYGRILEIHTAEDWVNLCRRYPLEVTASRRHDWFHTTGRHGKWVIPDWQSVASEWDAVHLTVLGYLSAAGRPLNVDEAAATLIAGWDPDSTLWLTDVAREWEGPRQAWKRDPNGGQWVRGDDVSG